MMMLNVLIMQTLLMKPLFSVMATAPNDSSKGSWSDREMIDGGRKLTGIGIKKSSGGFIGGFGTFIAEIRAR